MKKSLKILSTIMVIALTVVMISSNVALAVNPGNFSGTQVSSDGVTKTGNLIIGIVQTVGTIVAIVMLIVIGIKYMMGSAQEKAEYKKTMIPYLIGAVLIFAASNIAGWIYNFATTNIK